jgi:MoCo/4Fe-4S cofactor protein with predicted Tat translocation signal
MRQSIEVERMTIDPKNGTGKREDVCPSKKLDLDLVRERSDAAIAHDATEKSGPEYWRSLEELAGSPAFQEALHREFPKGASEWVDSVSRRGFMKVMGASMALAGMTGCVRLPLEPIVPYVRQPEEIIPGRPQFYATAMTLGGYANPILVESHMGRPTKIEGNDKHPASLGGTDIFAQAHVLGMYDPDRSQSVTEMGDQRSWQSFLTAIRGPLSAQKNLQGAGIRILTPTISSPTLADQMRNFLKIYPQAKWHVYEPVNRDNVLEGAKLAFGQPVETRYDFEKADVIVSLDADFLYAGFPGNVRYIRDFAKRRNPDGKMNRLYVIESTPTTTGAKADHRIPVRASEVERTANVLLSLMTAVKVGDIGKDSHPEMAGEFWPIIKDLHDHQGSSLVIAGDHQSPVVQAIAHVLNDFLGNLGKTVFYTDPVDANPVDQKESIKELVTDINGGKVDLLVILGGNPAYDAPADLDFANVLKNGKVPLRAHLSLYQNETAELCQWHVNQSHELEAWGDARAYDGTVSIIQPLIAPLYQGKSALEFVALLSGQADATGYDLVRAYWQKQRTGADFETFWRKSLHDGWVEGTTYSPKNIQAKAASREDPAGENRPMSGRELKSLAPLVDPNAIELNIRRDPTIYDGQFSNNGWLQELPKPMNKLTWDNAVQIGPKMAERLQIKVEDVVELELNGKKIQGPVWIQAGHPDNSVTVTLGYGRKRAGRVGTAVGFDAYALRTTAAPWIASGVKIRKTGETYKLASTQGMQSMDTPDGGHRPLVRETTLEEYRKQPDFATVEEPDPAPGLTLYKPYPYKEEEYAWGMAIDLNSCVGCNNCMVACQAENNIAVVGKEQAVIGRHMHWIRVDAYYQGDRDNPKAFFQPVPCQQCENAPCEVVCPVGATNHSNEGLNDMVYNRCVGTRYCSNNCPYKVRRFNFLLFSDWETPQYKMMRNPDVTVRSRGVMEKCTYCVQRINEHKIDAETASVREGKPIRVGDELQTACQQSCPAGAIIFGNLNDPNSKVSKLKAHSRNYSLLGELNTRPRTTYLAEVSNPNPELKG